VSSSKTAAILVALIVVVGVIQAAMYVRSRQGVAPGPVASTMPPGPGMGPGMPGPGGPGRPGFQAPNVPAQAPDFTLPLAAGGDVQLKALLAKGPVLLCFFKTECQTSQKAVPKYEAFQSQYAGKGLQVLGIVQNPPEHAAYFARQNNMSVPMAVDPAPYAVSGSYGILNTPTLVLVGADGKTLKVVPSWNRSALNDLARDIAKLTGAEYRDVSTAQDGMPDMLPG